MNACPHGQESLYLAIIEKWLITTKHCGQIQHNGQQDKVEAGTGKDNHISQFTDKKQPIASEKKKKKKIVNVYLR